MTKATKFSGSFLTAFRVHPLFFSRRKSSATSLVLVALVAAACPVAAQSTAEAVAPSSAATSSPAPEADGATTNATGSGTAGRITRWTSPNALGNSVILQKDGKIGIGTADPASKLSVNGATSGTATIRAFNNSSGYGIWGVSSKGRGVVGSGTQAGVYGVTNDAEGNGVHGVADSGTAAGVRGANSTGTGVIGTSTGGYGVYGRSDGDGGVVGITTKANGSGVYGQANGVDGAGVHGLNASGIGLLGTSTTGTGVRGNSADNVAVYGVSKAPNEFAVVGWNPASQNAGGVAGYSNDGHGVHGGSETGKGVRGNSDSGTGVYGQSRTGFAGEFAGNVKVTGTLSKGAGSFQIDHPLAPDRKYLSHSFVESPDMMNIYNGDVRLDEKGEATVQMPGYFSALNREFRYQLTCIGGFAPVYIAEEIAENRFRIAGGKPGQKVSWQVTGVRHDAYAEAHRIAVETEKTGAEIGQYLHPELFGQPSTRAIAKLSAPSADENAPSGGTN